jgi:dTDP-4-dehydrorhamnose 3,5-epimerase
MGLHFQKPTQTHIKLVCAIEGKVLDVAFDIRENYKYYGKHVSVILDSQQKNQLFIPRGFAHGFVVLS